MEGIKLASDAIFATIQGEGKLTGVPSIFIRLSGCNLFCTWNSQTNQPIECDTAYAAYRIKGSYSLTIEQIIQKISEIKGKQQITHVVITGGEPLLQAAQLTNLCKRLKEQGFHITIESNGTLFDQDLFNLIDLYSISPKLASSLPSDSKLAELHNSKRVNIETLTQIINSAKAGNKELQLKFVVTGATDINEIEQILLGLPQIETTDTLLMVAGSDSETLDKTTNDVLEKIIEKGWRYCDRLHIRLFGNKPGK